MSVPALAPAAGAAPAQAGTSTSTTGRTDPRSSSTATSTTAAPGATVEDDSPIPIPAASVPIADDPRIDPDLAGVALDSEGYQRAVADFLTTFNQARTVVARHDDAAGRFADAVKTLGDLLTARNRLEGEQRAATRRKDKADRRLEETRAQLRGMAVDQYVQGGLGGGPELAFDMAAANTLGQERVLAQSVRNEQVLDQRRAVRVRDEQAAALASITAELDEVKARIAATEAARDRAASERDQAEAERLRILPLLATRKQGVADSRLTAQVQGLDFTLVVFNAYVRAAKVMAVEQPSCGISWWALAGIGRTESRHGTFDGATVDADGNETKPIYGIALDGSNGTASIGDTDGGELDGDPNTDRATGPMQFIPGTWKRVGRDGNGDGIADPQNYYDAALTAAVYLCRRGPGLDTDDGLVRAYLSYNNDDSYARTVLSRAHFYRRHQLPTVSRPAADDPLSVPLPTTTTTRPPPRTTTTRPSATAR